MNGFGRRDWFGLAEYEPGERRRGGFLYLLDEVGSTSDFLLGRGDAAVGRLCRWDGWGWQAGPRAELTPPAEVRAVSVAVARRQVAGRGRRGRVWYGGGGLLMSWVVPSVPRDRISRLSVWTGLMVAEAVSAAAGRDVRLKWPNDLVLSERKLGGMILDLVQRGPRHLLVAGLGLNLGPWPADAPRRVLDQAATLEEEARPARLAGAVLTRCDDELRGFLAGGWPAFRGRLDGRDLLKGRRVRLDEGGAAVEVEVLGIDDDGALHVRDPAGRERAVLAADVHLHDWKEDR